MQLEWQIDTKICSAAWGNRHSGHIAHRFHWSDHAQSADLVRSADEVQVVLVEELGHGVAAKGIRHAAVVVPPALQHGAM